MSRITSMISALAQDIFRRMDQAERGFCLRFNRVCHRPRVERLFRLVSRLGDGIFWYAMMAVLPVIDGYAGFEAAAHMFVVGLLGVGIYWLLKNKLVRTRPFETHHDIRTCTVPLDKYSFPSGHTLHAVAFTIVVIGHYPLLGLVAAPFALLVALSRVALGLHYPTDVLAGATLGAGLAFASFGVV
jgi:undecaprenyl-diphosphatase